MHGALLRRGTLTITPSFDGRRTPMRLTGCLLLACGAGAGGALRAEAVGGSRGWWCLKAKATYNGEEVDDGKVKAYLA